MKKEQEFFEKINNKAKNHPLKDRLEEELRDHLEDAGAARQQTLEQSIDRLGTPRKIIRELRDADVSLKRFFLFGVVCGAVMSALYIVEVLLLHFYALSIVSTFSLIIFVLGVGAPIFAAILLFHKKYYSFAELFWYGFVFEFFFNSAKFVIDYRGGEYAIQWIRYYGTWGFVEVGMISFFSCIIVGVLSVVGGLLRNEMNKKNFYN